MDLQSRIRAFASWLKAHEDELRADPEGIQEGTALLDSAVSGECVVQDDVLHVILNAADPLWYYVFPLMDIDAEGIQLHCGRDPLKDEDYSVTLFDEEIQAAQVMTAVDAQQNVHFYHAALNACTEEEAVVCFRIMLQASLGDALAATQVRSLIKEEQPPEGSVSLCALYRQVSAETDGVLPADLFVPYQPALPAQRRALPRFDVLAGTSCLIALVNEYYLDVSRTYRHLQQMGICACYLTVDAKVQTLEELLDVRERIIDQLQEAFASGKLHGLLIGSALGEAKAYIDLLFVEPVSLQTMQELAGSDARLSLFPFHQGSAPTKIADYQADSAG